jgi:hypothetical protein
MTRDERGSDFTHKDPGGDTGALPRIDFSTFVLSLAASAMVHLGLAPDPEAGASEAGKRSSADLALARQTIDTLEMIQDKTRGNLQDEEAKLLQSVLYELRMAFVKAKGAGASG